MRTVLPRRIPDGSCFESCFEVLGSMRELLDRDGLRPARPASRCRNWFVLERAR